MEKTNDEVKNMTTFTLKTLILYRFERDQMHKHELYRLAEINKRSMIYTF